MKIEYDPVRDLLYLYFSSPDTKAAETVTIKPGVNVDFDKNDKLIGIEIIEAGEVIGKGIEFVLPKVVPYSQELKRVEV